MRTIPELLELMLAHKSYFRGGLCIWARDMAYYKIISYDEYYFLKQYIQNNRPSMFQSMDTWEHSNNPFFWQPNNIEPRIKWINKHILKAKPKFKLLQLNQCLK